MLLLLLLLLLCAVCYVGFVAGRMSDLVFAVKSGLQRSSVAATTPNKRVDSSDAARSADAVSGTKSVVEEKGVSFFFFFFFFFFFSFFD
jgi:hypothetical protein